VLIAMLAPASGPERADLIDDVVWAGGLLLSGIGSRAGAQDQEKSCVPFSARAFLPGKAAENGLGMLQLVGDGLAAPQQDQSGHDAPRDPRGSG
jgi:hypothetical protein